MLTEIQESIIKNTSQFAQYELINIESGHDWWHSWRVLQISTHLAQKENANVFVCSLAALLHDVSDAKFARSITNSNSKTKEYLFKLSIENPIKEAVWDIIENVSYSTGVSKKIKKSKELEVVQDADRLDAIGAIGIARAFNYGGYKNRTIHLPGTVPSIYSSTEDYRLSNSTTIMHFYEKLLQLKAMMNTQTARLIANERHEYMLGFLKRFIGEWNEFTELS